MADDRYLEGAAEAARAEWGRPAIPPGPVTTLVYRVPEERRDELLAFLSEAFTTYERPGGLRMALFENSEAPGIFMEMIAYGSAAEAEADREREVQSDALRETLRRWRELVGGPVEVRNMAPITIEKRGEQVAIAAAGPAVIEQIWKRRWGLPMCSPGRQYQPADVEGLAVTGRDGEVLALVTWAVDGAEAELTSLDALQTGRGYGSRLMESAEARLAARGVKRVHHFLANDNTPALAFYQRHGYHLAKIHPGAIDEIRKIKTIIPPAGRDGIPLRDAWEVVKELGA